MAAMAAACSCAAALALNPGAQRSSSSSSSSTSSSCTAARALRLRPARASASADSFPANLQEGHNTREQRLLSARQKIEMETLRREAYLKEMRDDKLVDSELKYGKLLAGQEEYDLALGHFERVNRHSRPQSARRAEATLQQALCLQHMGRVDEARSIYEELLTFPGGPLAYVRRKAALALRDLQPQLVAAPEAPDATQGQ